MKVSCRDLVVSVSLAGWLCIGTAGALEPGVRCQSSKNKEAGKLSSCLQKAEAKRVQTQDDVKYAADVKRCTDKFDDKWTRYEDRAGPGACPDGMADPNSMGDFIAAHCDAVATALAGEGLPVDVVTCNGDLTQCQLDLAACETAHCGNGVLDPNEDCELGTMEGGTCVGLGFVFGQLACAPGTCTYDVSGCRNEITIFSAGDGRVYGSLGDRATTSAICASEATSQGLTCSSTLTLLAYSGGDDIANMPVNHGVPASAPISAHGSGEKIADDWADFLDGTWDTCLGLSCEPAGPTAAGLVSGSFVTGANNDGTVYASGNCSDWNSISGDLTFGTAYCYGLYWNSLCWSGDTFYTGQFLNGCDDSAGPELLCLCY